MRHACVPTSVRKQRAPKGALRHNVVAGIEDVFALSQKAPSAKRCIKTRHDRNLTGIAVLVSESTERQKVH